MCDNSRLYCLCLLLDHRFEFGLQTASLAFSFQRNNAIFHLIHLDPEVFQLACLVGILLDDMHNALFLSLHSDQKVLFDLGQLMINRLVALLDLLLQLFQLSFGGFVGDRFEFSAHIFNSDLPHLGLQNSDQLVLLLRSFDYSIYRFFVFLGQNTCCFLRG